MTEGPSKRRPQEVDTCLKQLLIHQCLCLVRTVVLTDGLKDVVTYSAGNT